MPSLFGLIIIFLPLDFTVSTWSEGYISILRFEPMNYTKDFHFFSRHLIIVVARTRVFSYIPHSTTVGSRLSKYLSIIIIIFGVSTRIRTYLCGSID